jgi:phosphohistidine phosphatase SixA
MNSKPNPDRSGPRPAQIVTALWLAIGIAAAQAPSPAPAAPPQSQAPVTVIDVDTSWRPTLAGMELGNALRKGGYTLFFRHGVSDFSQQDLHLDGHGPCTEQRNLTDAGRKLASDIGADVKATRIPIGDVLASPFCRTRESAQLMFGRVTVTDDVRGGPTELGAEVNKPLLAILAKPPSAGTNRVIVGHTNAFFTITRLAHLDDGECAVFAVRDGKPFVVARIKPGGWLALGN